MDAATLTHHGCVLGRTGHGKTGLILGLAERCPVPLLVFDPKGDLGIRGAEHWWPGRRDFHLGVVGSTELECALLDQLRGRAPESDWARILSSPRAWLRGAEVPRAARLKLAHRCALARTGPQLDFTATNVIHLAELPEAERAAVVASTVVQVMEWMTLGSAKLMVVLDEARGFLPPVREPASKRPLSKLLATGRAHGVGVLLGTQHPVDLDYRALSNVGTWWVGGLRIRDLNRDLADVLDGYSPERLAPREFVLLARDGTTSVIRSPDAEFLPVPPCPTSEPVRRSPADWWQTLFQNWSLGI